METFHWCIVEDGAVSDRYATHDEAVAALPSYPAGSKVEWSYDPGIEDAG